MASPTLWCNIGATVLFDLPIKILHYLNNNINSAIEGLKIYIRSKWNCNKVLISSRDTSKNFFSQSTRVAQIIHQSKHFIMLWNEDWLIIYNLICLLMTLSREHFLDNTPNIYAFLVCLLCYEVWGLRCSTDSETKVRCQQNKLWM